MAKRNYADTNGLLRHRGIMFIVGKMVTRVSGEFRNVSSLRNRNPNKVNYSMAFIIHIEYPSQPCGMYADNSIFLGIEISRLVQYIDGDGILLQYIRVSLQGFLYNILQKVF